MKTFHLSLRVLAWAVGLGGLAWLVFTDSGNTYLAPGPLDKAHRSKSVACMKCHQPFAGTPDDRCAACHRRQGIQVKVASRFGGDAGLHVGVRGDCAECHRVHSKRTRPTIPASRHREFGFTLHEHEKVTCKQCHVRITAPASARLCNRCHLNLDDRAEFSAHATDISELLTAERKRASLGVTLDTGLEGADGEDEFEGARACTVCHTGGDEVDYTHLADGPKRGVTSAPAGKSPFFRGGHSSKEADDCAACHKKSLSALLSRACVTCHKDVHKLEGGADCTLCHNTASWKDRARGHSLTWACTDCHRTPAAHFKGECQSCHNSTRDWNATVFNHSGAACESCHKVPKGHFASECRSCHRSTKDWESATSRHEKGSACVECHKAPAGHFKGACQSCHPSVTRWKTATLDHPRVREHDYRSMACTNCHPKGYQQTSCTPCHRSNDPGEDDEGEGEEGEEREDDDD